MGQDGAGLGRAKRIEIFLDFARRQGGPVFGEIHRTMSAAHGPGRAIDDARLADVLWTETRRAKLLVGDAWDAYAAASAAVRRAMPNASARGHWRGVAYRPSGRTRAIETNLRLIVDEPVNHQNVFAVFTGLELLNELLNDMVKVSWDEALKDAQVRAAREPERLWAHFWDLGWYHGGAWSLTDMRNGWSHGYALIQGTGVVFQEPFKLAGRTLSVQEAWGYVEAGLATYDAFLLGSAAGEAWAAAGRAP